MIDTFKVTDYVMLVPMAVVLVGLVKSAFFGSKKQDMPWDVDTARLFPKSKR